MDLTEVKDAVKGLNPTEWQTLYLWAITEEKPRREKETALEEGAATLLADLREQGALPTPVKTADAPDKHTPWKTPKGDKTKMYLHGDRVFKDGRVWESQVQGLNHWAPGAPGVHETVWKDVTDVLFPPAPKDLGADGKATDTWHTGRKYAKGDRVAWSGDQWECLQDHQSQGDWEPDKAPSLWKKV